MAKSIKRNYLYNILLNISKVIFPLITAPYVSRVLEPDGVGLFNFANTYASYFSLFAALGIPYYGIREIAKIKDNTKAQSDFVSEIISLSVVSTTLTSVCLFLSLLFIPQLNENYVIFLISGIILYTTPFKIDWYFSGKEEFGYITLRSLVIKTLSVILLFLFVREKSDLLLYVVLNVSCMVLNEIWNFVKLYQSGIHPYFTLKWGQHIKPLIILFSSSIAISVYTILDTLMLGFMVGYDEVGYYNCATHISKNILPLVTSLAAVVLPRITQLRKEEKWEEINTLINKSFSIVSFLSIPIAVGIIIIAPTFTPLFFGEEFYGTIMPLQIIILTIIPIGFSNLTGIQILLGFGYDKLFLNSILIGTITNFLLNLVMIPWLGAAGAALSSLIAETLILAVMLYYVYNNTCIRFRKHKEFIFTLLYSMFFFVIAFLIKPYLVGWNFVFAVILACTFIYILAQRITGHSSIQILARVILNKFKSHKKV